MKRYFDLLLAIIILPGWAIFLLLLSVLIILIDRMSPFYSQKREGRDAKEFTCYKLQTLKPTGDEAQIDNKAGDESRLTKLGIFLRNHGFDELPQLVNILKGDMSFVGPRPLYHRTFKKIQDANPDLQTEVKTWIELRRRVQPGLSGWQQIHSKHHGFLRYDTEYLQAPTLKKRVIVLVVSTCILIIGKGLYFKHFAQTNP